MRLTLLGLTVLVGALGWGVESRAQVPFTNVNDPFFAYYSFYLPRQQAQALQPGPEATIATITANRQAYAATNRNDMFDTMSPGLADDSGEFGFQSNGRRRGRTNQASRIGGNLNGLGPAGYYNNNLGFHPTLRSGIHKNNNVSVLRSRGFSGGGAAGGSGGIGLPGVR